MDGSTGGGCPVGSAMFPRRVEQAYLEAGYADLQRLQSPTTGKRKRGEADAQPSKSKIDKKNESTLTILECTDRMLDMAKVLEDCANKLGDPEEKKYVKDDALKTIRSYVIPFLKAGPKVVRKAAISTSAMALMGPAYDRHARREKKKVVKLKSEKPAAVQMLEHSTKKFRANLVSIAANKSPPPPSQ